MLPWHKADSDLGTNSEVRLSLSLDSRCTFISRLPLSSTYSPCTMHPPRFTLRLLPPKPRDLVRDTPPRSGDTSQCRVSARARDFLRGSPRGCCYPNNGTSCVRLHPTVVMPCVCRARGILRGSPRGCCNQNHGRFKLLTCSTCSNAPYLEILDCRQALKFCVRYFLFIFFTILI